MWKIGVFGCKIREFIFWFFFCLEIGWLKNKLIGCFSRFVFFVYLEKKVRWFNGKSIDDCRFWFNWRGRDLSRFKNIWRVWSFWIFKFNFDCDDGFYDRLVIWSNWIVRNVFRKIIDFGFCRWFSSGFENRDDG